MKIQFKKEAHKPSTLTCIRDDGSKTWTKLNPAIEIHDLAHYVVETELAFNNAFYGLLKKGYAIQDFELPAEQRPEALQPKNLSEEALQTEHIVNLIQVHFDHKIDPHDFLTTLKTILRNNRLSFPKALDQDKLLTILQKLNQLFLEWHDLKPGEDIELSF